MNRNSQETDRKQTGTILVFCSFGKIVAYRTTGLDVKSMKGVTVLFPLKPR